MTPDMKPGEPSEEEQRDEALDEALEETFPTSDPIQLSAHLGHPVSRIGKELSQGDSAVASTSWQPG